MAFPHTTHHEGATPNNDTPAANSKKLNITPLHDRVVVKPTFEKATSKDVVRRFNQGIKENDLTGLKGIVVAVGPGGGHEGSVKVMTVKIGDTILYGKYAGCEVELDAELYLIMRESDILAIL